MCPTILDRYGILLDTKEDLLQDGHRPVEIPSLTYVESNEIAMNSVPNTV